MSNDRGLATYSLGLGSVVDGGTCPVCGDPLIVGETVVRCPKCASYSHLPCWGFVGNRCGRLGCAGAGAPDLESTARRSPVRVLSVDPVQPRPPRIKIGRGNRSS